MSTPTQMPPAMRRTAQPATAPTAASPVPAAAPDPKAQARAELAAVKAELADLQFRVKAVEEHEAKHAKARRDVEKLRKELYEKTDDLQRRLTKASTLASELDVAGSAGRFELPGLKKRAEELDRESKRLAAIAGEG